MTPTTLILDNLNFFLKVLFSGGGCSKVSVRALTTCPNLIHFSHLTTTRHSVETTVPSSQGGVQWELAHFQGLEKAILGALYQERGAGYWWEVSGWISAKRVFQATLLCSRAPSTPSVCSIPNDTAHASLGHKPLLGDISKVGAKCYQIRTVHSFTLVVVFYTLFA